MKTMTLVPPPAYAPVFIVIAVFNRKELTRACLESLLQQDYPSFQIIVVDDGSTDGTADMLHTHFPAVTVLPGTGDLWWTGATNKGIEHVLHTLQAPENAFILTLNNDLVVNPDYLKQLARVSREQAPCIVGSPSVDIANGKLSSAGVQWNRYIASYRYTVHRVANLKELQQKYPEGWLPSDLLPGRGVLIPLPAFHRLGLYDIRNFPQYMADEDFSFRCKKGGYTVCIATKAVVYSHVKETGLKEISMRKSLRAVIRENFLSIRSTNNLPIRWKWARKHTPIPALYFSLDLSRILLSNVKRMF